MFEVNQTEVYCENDFLQKIDQIMYENLYDESIDLMITTTPFSFDVVNIETNQQLVIKMNKELDETDSDHFLQNILKQVKKHNWKEINFEN